MIIDATFWVAISFIIFLGFLIYLKIPKKIKNLLDDNIKKIKNQIDEAEKLKEEAKNKLSEQEARLAKAKKEIADMIKQATESSEKNILKANENFHKVIEIRKKNTEEKIRQMKSQAIKEIKNSALDIALESVEKLMVNSLDKNKLDNIFNQSIEETKIALQKKSS
tara:strand:+ start:880 stop:1377 length:498 start_codon:yes stop_codon:yes gene_type:complete